MPDDRPTRSIFQIYVYAVCLTTVLILLFSVASLIYAIVRIATPGTTGVSGFDLSALSIFGFGGSSAGSGAERDHGIVQLIQSLILGGVSAGLFSVHWRWANRLREQEAAQPAPTRVVTRKARTRKARPASPVEGEPPVG